MPFPPTQIGNRQPSITLLILAMKLQLEVEAGAESRCKYVPAGFSKPYCELQNQYYSDEMPAMPLTDCDATLGDVCPVTADACPVSRMLATALLFWGFGMAIIPCSYLISFLFEHHTAAQIYSILITFIVGVVLSLVSMILDTADFEDPSIAVMNRSLKWFYRALSPGFCLGNGLLDMAFASFGVSLGGDSGTQMLVGASNPLGWDNSGRDIFFLFVSSPCLLGLVILVDLMRSTPLCAELCGLVADTGFDERDDENDDDTDVAAEASRVAAGNGGDEAIRLVKLRKVYGGGRRCWCCCRRRTRKVAVRSLSFGIEKGECFGFLGINGAGKTTTMNMLTGKFLPTSGNAYLNGLDIRTNQLQIRSQLGYCPQHDALLDLLTVREHLFLFGRVKGVPED
eukprot:SAG22_NODE_4448_length_1267_cov_1.363870_1_plen_397_part_01